MKANFRFSQLLSPSFFTLLLVISCGGTESSSQAQQSMMSKVSWQASDLEGHWDSGCMDFGDTTSRFVLSLTSGYYTQATCDYRTLGHCEAKSNGEGNLFSSSFYIYPQELKAESLSLGTPITSMPGSYFVGEYSSGHDSYLWGSSTSKDTLLYVWTDDNYLIDEDVHFSNLSSNSSDNEFLTKDWSQTSENSADAIFLQRIDLEKEELELSDLGCTPRPHSEA